MTTRPYSIPFWCTSNPTNMVAPSASQVELGYQPNEVPTAEVTNELLNSQANWIAYLDSQSNSASMTSALEPSLRLLSSGAFSFSLANNTLSWASPLYLAYPGASDTANTVAPGSVVVPPGSVAYVIANAPFSTTASTTTGSATLTSVQYADQISVGWTVSGPGIPQNTTVQSLGTDGSSVQISASATATAGGVTLTFAGSGTLSVQAATGATLTPTANMVVLARATETRVYVGVGTGQMVLHDGESKLLLEDGFSVRRVVAGSSLSALQAVYLSQGVADTTSAGAATNRTAGQAYPADASNGFVARNAVVGFSISQQASGNTAQIATAGLLPGFSNLTPGQVYYLDPSNPGGITPTKPTAAGSYVVPVGQALSALSLLINPAAATAATQVSTNLTLPGTITGNSIVSGQGFRQQVDMGCLYVQSGQTMQNNQNVTVPVGLQRFYALYNQSGGNAGTRYWPAGVPGSVLAVQVYSNLQMNGPLVFALYAYFPNEARPDLPFMQGSFGSSLTSLGGVYCATASFPKGQYSFPASTVFLMKLGFSSALQSDCTLSCDMTVEQGA